MQWSYQCEMRQTMHTGPAAGKKNQKKKTTRNHAWFLKVEILISPQVFTLASLHDTSFPSTTLQCEAAQTLFIYI